MRQHSRKTRSLLELVALSGFDRPQNLIHLFVGGSELHGAKVGKTDDTDLYGVYVEDPEQVLGLDSREHFVWSTAGDERRNGPDDVDVTLYSLRKMGRDGGQGQRHRAAFSLCRSERCRAQGLEEDPGAE